MGIVAFFGVITKLFVPVPSGYNQAETLMANIRTNLRTILLILVSAIALTIQAGDDLQRSEADAKRDATSKPFAILDFMGVKPGWQVIDVFAGNGYYSEVIAHRIGEKGKVYLHNNQAYLSYADKLDERIKDNRLPNVEVYTQEVEDIDLSANSLDMAILVMVYHDAYLVQEGWSVTAKPLFAAIQRVLKPGGVLAIIDHHATTGSGKAAVQKLHRIDADFAKADIESHGFKFVAATSILKNSEDDLSLSVFDPAVRGHTSRFVYKFLKP